MQEIVLNDPQLKREKESEFKDGLRPDGTIIGYYRDVEYAIFKNEINPSAGGRVDLILSGDFVRAMRVELVAPTAYIFNSTDWKTSHLIGKYGQDIMGINDDYWTKRQIDVYLPVFRFQIKRKANL